MTLAYGPIVGENPNLRPNPRQRVARGGRTSQDVAPLFMQIVLPEPTLDRALTANWKIYGNRLGDPAVPDTLAIPPEARYMFIAPNGANVFLLMSQGNTTAQLQVYLPDNVESAYPIPDGGGINGEWIQLPLPTDPSRPRCVALAAAGPCTVNIQWGY